MTDNCPHCGVTLIGSPIPEDLKATGAYGDKTHWRREIGIYSRETDRTVSYQCPDCGKGWQ